MTEAETFIVSDGLNPRDDEWDIDWDERIGVEGGGIAVSFDPYHGLYPVYCSCLGVSGEYALLKVPPKSDEPHPPTDWFPVEGWSWVIVPEKYIRP